MKIYFTGLNIDFIHRVREIIQIQNKENEVVLIPSQYIESGSLFYYDEKEKKLIKIQSVKEHSF